MRPKFELGEIVLIHWPGASVHGKDTVVVNSYYSENTPSAKSGKLLPPGIFYATDLVSEQGSAVYQEVNLRKKHTPGELSFTDLMASLSSPKLITHTP